MASMAGYSTLNGGTGVGFYMSWINYDDAISDVSAEEVLGMSKWCGKKSTVYKVLSDLVITM